MLLRLLCWMSMVGFKYSSGGLSNWSIQCLPFAWSSPYYHFPMLGLANLLSPSSCSSRPSSCEAHSSASNDQCKVALTLWSTQCPKMFDQIWRLLSRLQVVSFDRILLTKEKHALSASFPLSTNCFTKQDTNLSGRSGTIATGNQLTAPDKHKIWCGTGASLLC
jgi:hypothetical protein